jgi:hypothetical protein
MAWHNGKQMRHLRHNHWLMPKIEKMNRARFQERQQDWEEDNACSEMDSPMEQGAQVVTDDDSDRRQRGGHPLTRPTNEDAPSSCLDVSNAFF